MDIIEILLRAVHIIMYILCENNGYFSHDGTTLSFLWLRIRRIHTSFVLLIECLVRMASALAHPQVTPSPTCYCSRAIYAQCSRDPPPPLSLKSRRLPFPGFAAAPVTQINSSGVM